MFPGKNISIASSKFVSKNDCNKHKSWQYKKPQKSATDSLVRKKEEISWDGRFSKNNARRLIDKKSFGYKKKLRRLFRFMNCNFSVSFIKSLHQSGIKPCLREHTLMKI